MLSVHCWGCDMKVGAFLQTPVDSELPTEPSKITEEAGRAGTLNHGRAKHGQIWSKQSYVKYLASAGQSSTILTLWKFIARQSKDCLVT